MDTTLTQTETLPYLAKHNIIDLNIRFTDTTGLSHAEIARICSINSGIDISEQDINDFYSNAFGIREPEYYVREAELMKVYEQQ